MVGGQPYLYNAPAPVQYSVLNPIDNFDPKAVSRASWAAPPPSMPKPEGPLLSFNRHPDSWNAQPYGKLNYTPMNPNTKTKIKWTRGIQLASRILQLFGVIAMLVLVISIKGVSDNEGWIVRLPVIIDSVTTVYGTYHLLRKATARTPASSASYHFFALLVDTGLVPFYLFITFVGKANYQQAPGTDGRWRTLFSAEDATTKVLHAIWLTAITVGGLHLFSFFLDIYLLIVFRKIAQMPPDMNPLEDNLTSRRKSKHKYKNSSVSEIDGKRFSEVTTSTFMSSKSVAQAQSLLGQPKSSGISFIQSRTDKDGSFNPHNPNTARMSAVSLVDAYPSSRITSQMPSMPTMSKRNSAMSIPVLSDPADQQYHEPVSPMQDEGNNWQTLDEDHESVSEYDPYRANSVRIAPQKGSGGNYEVLNQSTSNFIQQPLGMNPPTPPLPSAPVHHMNSPLSQLSRKYQEHDKENDRTHTMVSDVSALSMSSRYSNDETVISAAPTATTSSSADATKSRYYGDLAAAMRGVRQHGVSSPRPKSMVGSVHNAGSDISSLRPLPQRGSAILPRSQKGTPRKHMDSVSGTVIRRPTDEDVRQEQSPRVLSRSGVDYGAEGDLGLGSNRREVSGKRAEEGRGGYKRTGLFMRKVSGMS